MTILAELNTLLTDLMIQVETGKLSDKALDELNNIVKELGLQKTDLQMFRHSCATFLILPPPEGLGYTEEKVKDYFEGPSQKGPLILFIVGMCTIIIVIGVFLLIAALVWFLVNKFSPDLSGEAEVDAAKNYEIEKAKEIIQLIDQWN